MHVTDDDIYHTADMQVLFEENKQGVVLRQISIKPGQEILVQGQSVKELYFVMSGTISLHRNALQGRRYQVGCFRHNGFLGLMEKFSLQPCFYSVIAETECELYVIDGEKFSQLIYNTPDLAASVFRHITTKWYTSVERMTRHILHTIKYCVIDDLLQFYLSNPNQLYSVNKNVECERLGTSLRVYNRILKQLEETGAIEVAKRDIKLVNLDILQNERLCEAEK